MASSSTSSTSSATTRKRCQLCSFQATSLKFLLKHINLAHAHKPGFRITCLLSGCQRTFTTFQVFRNHIYAFHSEQESVVLPQQLEAASDTLNIEDGCDECEDQTEGDDDQHTNITPLFNSASRKKAAAVWILKIQEKYKLPQSTMDLILKDITVFNQYMIGDLHDAVKTTLSNADVDPSSLSGFSGLFDENSVFANPFTGLETKYTQTKYYKDALGFVEPQSILLGTEKRWKGFGQKRSYAETHDEMMYVPILETIQTLLNDPEVIKQIESGHQSTNGVLRDYCDGTSFSSHPLRSLDDKFLQIFLYMDDVEVCNPIGSRRVIHKIGLYYFVLGNLPPKFRSRTKHIQLAAIAQTEHLKRYGSNAILKPIIEDIQKLETGHTFMINGKPQKKWGTVCVVPADNLASNVLGGFKEGSTAHRGCRHCLATLSQFKSIFKESNLTLRSITDHVNKCDQLEAATTQREYQSLSTEFGINHRSILNNLQYFNVCNGGMIQDVMHDVLEGVLEYETKELLLKHIDFERYYTLDYLNQQILALELGYMESRDRPSTIAGHNLRSNDHKLKQEAGQMWLFGRMIPQMIGHKVPVDDDHWRGFNDLLQIVDILMAPEVTEDDVVLLSTMISDHLHHFKILYPHASITPKWHYLIHMARLMLVYGPLRNLWTMRFESKHSYFKKLTQTIGNFINLPYTLAQRHQKLQCYNRLDEDDFSSGLVNLGPGTVVPPTVAPAAVANHGGKILRVKWVEFDGTLYKKPCCLLFKIEPDNPTFAKVVDIFVLNSKKIIFELQPLQTIEFSDHFHSYVVASALSSPTVYVPVESLVSFLPHHLRILPRSVNTLCIVPRHHFVINHVN